MRYLDGAMNLSNRTKLELETGALNVGMEWWLRHVNDALMIHTLHRLIFSPNIGK